MEQVSFTIKMDNDLIFDRAKLLSQKLRENAVINGTADMSLDEINKEI